MEDYVVEVFGKFLGEISVLLDSFLFCILFLEFYQEVVSNENDKKFGNYKFML